jgi:hypothetical protein
MPDKMGGPRQRSTTAKTRKEFREMQHQQQQQQQVQQQQKAQHRPKESKQKLAQTSKLRFPQIISFYLCFSWKTAIKNLNSDESHPMCLIHNAHQGKFPSFCQNLK